MLKSDVSALGVSERKIVFKLFDQAHVGDKLYDLLYHKDEFKRINI